MTNKKRRPLTSRILRLTVVLIPCLIVGCLLFARIQIHHMEEGILEICALQQDAYVDLVLSQINLEENRDNEEIITEILATLDASNNKYWTFSEGQTMLFVKDVLETNRYKGFTTTSYYAADSAREFIQSLELDQVSHGAIEVGEREYIASGVNFSYRGSVYSLCLLTNRSVLLDNNMYLKTRTEFWIMIFLVMAFLFILPVLLAMAADGLQKKYDKSQRKIEELNRLVTELDGRLSRREILETNNGFWEEDALTQFVAGLVRRGERQVTFIRLGFADQDARGAFAEWARWGLPPEVLRFLAEEQDVILLFPRLSGESAEELLRPGLLPGVTIQQVEESGGDERSIATALLSVLHETDALVGV